MMTRGRHSFAFVMLLGLSGLAGCPDDEFAVSTWTKKLGNGAFVAAT